MSNSALLKENNLTVLYEERSMQSVRLKFVRVWRRPWSSSTISPIKEHDPMLLQEAIAIIENRMPGAGDTTELSKPAKNPYNSLRTMDLKLYGPDCMMLDAYSRFCIASGRAAGALMPDGPTMLPLRIQKWSVLSSPHVHKTAWTQLERRTYARGVSIRGLQGDALKRYWWYIQQHCPPDVRLECTMHDYISLPQLLGAAAAASCGTTIQ
jgi:ribosomal protein S10